MMKLGIMQPYFFPYIGYFQLIKNVDEFILYDDVSFIKKGWVNRNNVLINGNPFLLNVPLKGKSSFKKINEIELLEDPAWRKKMLRDLQVNYKQAKYFNDVYPILEKVINYPTAKLSELNFQSIKCVSDYLGLPTKIVTGDSGFADIEHKLKSEILDETIFPDTKLTHWIRKTVRIIEICRKKNAQAYFNPIGGLGLYSKEEFLLNKIDLKFIKSRSIVYKQFNHEFVPNLSIIDVLMFNSVDEVNLLLDEFDLL